MNIVAEGVKGVVAGVAEGVVNVTKVFAGSKADRDAGDQKTQEAVINQFAAEFVARQQRTWWDSFVDGLNRLPRPLAAFICLGVLVWAPIDPVSFATTMQVYSLVPSWVYLGMAQILFFFFGGRMIASAGGMKALSVSQVRDVMASIAELKKLGQKPMPDSEFAKEMADTTKPMSNTAVEEWNRRRAK